MVPCSAVRTRRFPNILMTTIRKLTTLLAVSLLSACATVEFDHPKAESTALPPAETSDTLLGRSATALVAGKPADRSGFYLIPDAVDALAARLVLINQAERTIDAQYYLVKADDAGRAFVRNLLQAADRGVRVRLLIDDMFTSGYDIGLAALDHHPNVEVRIWNPFGTRNARFWDGITNFSRINRRMHNKSFTVDNQVTIVGGRNIADEYFGAREDAVFGDLDFVAIGPLVPEVSNSFDTYWNHERAAPVPAFAKQLPDPDAALAELRTKLEEWRQHLNKAAYVDALHQSALALLEADGTSFEWAEYQFVVDSPDKTYKKLDNGPGSIISALTRSIGASTEEVILISPYFVPTRNGIDNILKLEQRGVDFTVITNSLAANNQFTVHGGYAPSRKPLLKGGVKIYEVRRDAHFSGQDFVAASGAKATLHTKAFIVDRRDFFIGSFNFDPRSAYINTELGVIIRSPKLAGAAAARIDEGLGDRAWEVRLDDRSRLRWHGIGSDGEPVVLTKEPQTSWWDRFVAGFVRILPIRGQL